MVAEAATNAVNSTISTGKSALGIAWKVAKTASMISGGLALVGVFSGAAAIAPAAYAGASLAGANQITDWATTGLKEASKMLGSLTGPAA